MAMAKLPTNFIDAQTTQQKYKVTDVGNNEALFEDVSEYSQDGSYFGANEINDQHQAINDLITLVESTESSIARLKSGSIPTDSVTYAESVTTVNMADKATTVKSVDNDIVINEQTLTFTNKVCTISNSKITADSLANVIFSRDTVDIARKSVISVETSNGAVTLRAGRTPSSALKARINIRVI